MTRTTLSGRSRCARVSATAIGRWLSRTIATCSGLWPAPSALGAQVATMLVTRSKSRGRAGPPGGHRVGPDHRAGIVVSPVGVAGRLRERHRCPLPVTPRPAGAQRGGEELAHSGDEPRHLVGDQSDVRLGRRLHRQAGAVAARP